MVYGMFETRSSFNYKITNQSINIDSFTWKQYNISRSVNSYDLYEVKINMSDATIFGTKDSWEKLDESINRYQIRLD